MLKWCFIASLLLNLTCFGFTPPANNATAISLGGACATYKNPFALENNPAVLAFTTNTLAANVQNRFGLNEYSSLHVAMCYTRDNGTIGIGYSNSPFGQLGLQKLNASFARKFDKNLSVGVGINYIAVRSADAFYPNANALTFNAGLYYQINDKLNAGFSISNPNRSMLIRQTNERLPATFRFGIDYKIADKVTLYGDGLQQTNFQLQLLSGVEVEANLFKVRAGFGTNQTLAFGLGYTKPKIAIDIALQYHNQLGISPALNFSYAF